MKKLVNKNLSSALSCRSFLHLQHLSPLSSVCTKQVFAWGFLWGLGFEKHEWPRQNLAAINWDQGFTSGSLHSSAFCSTTFVVYWCKIINQLQTISWFKIALLLEEGNIAHLPCWRRASLRDVPSTPFSLFVLCTKGILEESSLLCNEESSIIL